MRMHLLRKLAFFSLLLASAAKCSSTASKDARSPGLYGNDKRAGTETGARRAPRLTVAIVLDQFPSYVLNDYLPHLDQDGLLRRIHRDGLFVHSARIDYANTSTGPGHAAIHTGQPPSRSGVDANAVWNRERKAEIPIIAQEGALIFGKDGATAGPQVLKAVTVSDALRKKHPKARIVSLSHKARAAILSGGHSADLAFWYDSSLGGFTSSSHYADALPRWLADFNRAHTPEQYLEVWKAESPELYAQLIGKDAAEGEANWYGLGTTFPHEPKKADKPAKVILSTPAGSRWLIDAANAAIAHYELGADETPDLLAISFSTTDYAGHSFSVTSWEYLDLLRKTDRMLGQFADELSEATGGDIAFVLTSDHGGPLLPERLGRGGRIVHEDFVEQMNRAVVSKLGPGTWIEAYVSPYLYLSQAAQARQAEVVAQLREAIESEPAVAELIVANEANEGATSSTDELRRSVALSIAPWRRDLYVLAAPGYMTDPDRKPDIGKGCNHGTPTERDRNVPVFVLGPGHTGRVEKGAHGQIAPTLAAILAVSWESAHPPFAATATTR